MLTNVQSLRAQGKAHCFSLWQQVRLAVFEKRFATFIILGFLVVYAFAAHELVRQGLGFVMGVPVVGEMLTERMLFLLFFFFFVMLILSNATITGIGLFRRQETQWLLTLPVPQESLVLWRAVEGMVLSSWGMVLLSAPILAAFSHAFKAGVAFYLNGLPALLCLIVIAANVSTWLLLVVVCYYRRWWWKVIIAAAVLFGVSIAYDLRQVGTRHIVALDMASNVNQILRYTRLCVHPLIPSTWVTEALIATGKEQQSRAWFYHLTLLSYAMVSWLVTAALARRIFFSSWNRLFLRSQVGPGPSAALRAGRRSWFLRALASIGVSRPYLSLIAKDGCTFIREPMQWGQCVLIFGLLLTYSWNLRHLGYNQTDSHWTPIISYLNLTVCSLATSTLSTRFMFPQFSMEGRRFWILGMAPFSLSQVLRQKLWLNVGATCPITVLLVLISCFSLRLPTHSTGYFTASMLLINFGLAAMSLSLGALLPNFRETNPAKIVSGFGGTVCLVLSFLYILCAISMLLPPAFADQVMGRPTSPREMHLLELGCLGGLVLLTLLFGGVPYWIAKRRTKELAYLGNL